MKCLVFPHQSALISLIKDEIVKVLLRFHQQLDKTHIRIVKI